MNSIYHMEGHGHVNLLVISVISDVEFHPDPDGDTFFRAVIDSCWCDLKGGDIERTQLLEAWKIAHTTCHYINSPPILGVNTNDKD